MRLLTQAEVSMLPAGTEVWVIWSCGWEAKAYRIRYKGGMPCAVSDGSPHIVAGILGMVGDGVFDDRVWLAESTLRRIQEQVACA